jgi:holdfast attachment protein HfaA
MSTNSATFNAGWNRTAGQENRPIDPSTADANGNQVVINGQIMNGNSQSIFASGASTSFAGAGSGTGGATAIGNNLTVITQGDNNVVVIDSRQTNNGNVTATQNTSVSDHGS